MFSTIGFDPEHKLHTKCDNKQKEDLVVRFRLGNVDVHQRGTIASIGCSLPSCGLTKLLSPKKHAEFVKMLGLVELPPEQV